VRENAVTLMANAGAAAAVTFMPLYAKEQLHISDSYIGIAVTLYALALFLSSYVFGRAADIQGLRRYILAGLFLSAIALFMHVLVRDVYTLWAVRIFTGVAVGLYPAALVDYVTRRSGKLGQYSAFGSFGFGAGNLAASVLVQYYTGITGAFLMAAAVMFAGFAVALALRPVPEVHHVVPLFPRRLIRRNIHIYAPMLLRHSGATGIWVYWPLFLMSIGADYLWIGIIQFINPLAQFVFMYWFTDRIRTKWLFPVGLLLSSIVMVSFTIATNVWQLLPTQVLLGVAWSCTYVGALRSVTEGAVEKSTVAGLLTSVTSVSQVIGPAISTVMVSATHVYRTEMYIGAAMSMAALLLYLVLRKYAQEDGPVTASSAGTTPPP